MQFATRFDILKRLTAGEKKQNNKYKYKTKQYFRRFMLNPGTPLSSLISVSKYII
jgi:hypothetical protein